MEFSSAMVTHPSERDGAGLFCMPPDGDRSAARRPCPLLPRGLPKGDRRRRSSGAAGPAVAVLLAAAAAAPLAAHDGEHLAWRASPWDAGALALLAIAGALYAVGSARMTRRGARVRGLERAAFWCGWLVLVIAVAPPMDRAAALTFSMHMVQHELMMLVGAPLVIVGRPIVPWLWAMPDHVRAAAGSGLQLRPLHRGWQVLTAPVVAWAMHGAAIWVWHLPVLYEAAVASEGVHALQHAMFVGTSILFWWGLVYGRYGRAAYGASAMYVFTTMVHTGVLGAAFALSSAPVYGVYRDRAAASGIDPVADQQLAGLFMWIPAGIVLTASALALMIAWLSEAERRQRAANGTAGPARTRAPGRPRTL